MFDNAKEPVDIFAEVDKAPTPGAPMPGQSAPRVPVPPPTVARGPSRLLLGAIVLVILGLAGGGYYLFVAKKAPNQQLAVNAPVNEAAAPAAPTAPEAAPTPAAPTPEQTPAAPTAPEAAPTPAAPQPTEPVSPPEQATAPVDSDGDGLPDSVELTLGTNPNAADTDNDGLSDREEVEIYKTDPLKPDTDGDGYLDGQEVKGGYNPLGPGKLLVIPPPQ